MADPSDKHDETAVYALTPPGRGAVAVIAVVGNDALRLIEQSFRPPIGVPLSQFNADQIVYGRWGREPAEEVIVWIRSANEVEVHCHGGRAAIARIIDDLMSGGAIRRDWQEWIASQESSPIRRAARRALADALTMRTAAILLDQYHGALHSAIEQIVQLLGGSPNDVQIAANRLEAIIRRSSIGLHTTSPWRVTIVGPPNVGKSSLLNALAGFERAIVFDQPGTTRDVLTVLTAIDGWPVELADTAGWRESCDPIEAAGVERAGRQAAISDLVMLVFDGSVAFTADDQSLLARWPQALVVQNKSDLISPSNSLRLAQALATSAKTGTGLHELMQAITRRLVPIEPSPGDAIPFTNQQLTTFRAASSAIASGETELAKQHLLSLLAESAT
jgi:tRNA modification GTPase